MSSKKGIRTTEAVVIGAGTIGCATAYHLARSGIKTILTDRNTVGSGNTSLAASLLTRIRGKEPIIPLVKETYANIEVLHDEIESRLDISDWGSLHIAASAESSSELQKLVKIAQTHHIGHDHLALGEVKKMVPWLAVDKVQQALFIPGDAHLDAYVLTQGFAAGAKMYGAEIAQHTHVTGLIMEQDKVKGIESEQGPIYADYVVDAAGAWSNLISLKAGVALPMTPVRSNYWITAKDKELFNADQPIVILPDASAYTRPESGGLLFGLRESNSIHFDPRNLPADLTGYTFGNPGDQWNILMEQGEKLRRFFPMFDQVSIPHYISGVSTYTPDGMFVIGGVPGVKGFLAATGCSGAGVAVSGGMGRLIAEMANGQEPFCDTRPFRPDRFGTIDPFSEEFMVRCAKARSRKTSG